MLIDGVVKRGEWNNIFEGSTVLSPCEIIDGIIIFYDLDVSVSDCLELSYTTYMCDKGNAKEGRLVTKYL